MDQILITRANGTVELLNDSSTVSVVTKTEQRKAFLGEDVLVITVESAEDRGFSIGDKIKLFDTITYKINQIPRLERKSERKIVYDLTFEGLQYDLIRAVYRNEDVSSFNTTSNFTLVGDIEMYLNVLINNANRVFGSGKWELGDFPANTETKNLLFNAENCLSVLWRICQEYEYGFVIEETSTKNILHVRKVGSDLDYSFQYGRGKGLYNLSRQKVDSRNIVNTLYVYGSDKNIPYNYKNFSERLRLGLADSEPVLTANDSITAFGTFEGVAVFDEIFPSREATVTGISITNRLEFYDSTMFDLNEKDGSGNTKYLIPGNNPKIQFNSGNLAGYSFEVEKYNHGTRLFTLKQNIDPKGLNMPSLTEEAFQIEFGDKYVILDIVLPSSYISDAESRLEAKAEAFLLENKVPIVQYSLSIDEVFLKTKTSSKNAFEVGDTVSIKDDEFLIDSRIKIIGFSRDIRYPFAYNLTISENKAESLLSSLVRNTKSLNGVIKSKALNDPTKQKQDNTLNTQIVSQIDEQVNRKPTVKIGRESENLELGNPDNQTLVKLLGGSMQLGQKSMFYEGSVIDGDGTEQYYVGIDAWNVHFEGGIEVVDLLSVGQGAFTVQKKLEENNEVSYAEIGGGTYINVTVPEINILNTLGVNEIVSVSEFPIEVQSKVNFNYPIYIVDSNEPNAAISRQFFDMAVAALDFGDIRIYPPIRAASNGSNVTLSGFQTLDGVVLVDGNKVLVKDNIDKTQNYIYIVRAGAWERVTDLPNNSIKGLQVQVVEGGVVNRGGVFVNVNSDDVVVGTTEVIFRQSFQNVLNPYVASLAANGQVFYGTNKFLEKLEVRTPQSGDEAANMAYVIDKTKEVTDLVIANYWPKISSYGIGTITGDSFNLYANNTKRAALLANGRLTGLTGIHINEGVFTQPYATTFPTYYGLTVRDNVQIGAIGGTSKALYSADFVRGSNSGNRAGLRFGSYLSSGQVNSFDYGIEYSTAGNLTIGRYGSTAMNGASTSLDDTKSIIVSSAGNVGIGKVPTEKMDIVGNINYTGRIKINGTAATANQILTSDGTSDVWSLIGVQSIADIATYYQAKLNGTGFVKMNGTTVSYERFGEFGQYLNSSENPNIFDAPWGASYVAGLITNLPNGIYQGHSIKMSLGEDRADDATFLAFGLPNATFDGKLYARGIYGEEDTGWKSIGGDIGNYTINSSYNDSEVELRGFYLEVTEDDNFCFVGIDKTNGTYDIQMRVANNENETVTDYRNFIDLDGRWYFQNGTNAPQKYLLAGEVSGGGSGTAYTLKDPLYFIGNEINVREASASQVGVLTAAKFTEFNGKLADGGTVEDSLNFAFTKSINFLNADGTDYIHRALSTNTGIDKYTEITYGVRTISATEDIEIYAGVGKYVYIEDIAFDMSNVPSLVGQRAEFQITSLGGGKYKAQLVLAI